jgi:gliding motility-associated protein GldL
MTFAELTQTKGWKNFMAKLYGIGAAVVIVGALFKIMHWPGAGPMLVVGLTTEAVIFIFSAFEPLHEELDWTLAYPELLGIDDEDGGGGHGHGRRGKPAEAGGGGLSEIDRLLLKSVDNDKGIFDQIGKGLKSLSETAAGLSDISAATVATKAYTQNM